MDFLRLTFILLSLFACFFQQSMAKKHFYGAGYGGRTNDAGNGRFGTDRHYGSGYGGRTNSFWGKRAYNLKNFW